MCTTPQKIEGVELKVIEEEEKPVYEIKGTQNAKLFWVFPVTIPVTTQVNVENGEIAKLEKPWWSFLAW